MQLTGNLEDLGMGEIFQILNFSGKSGVLRLRNTKMDGSIVFKDGNVVKAACSALKEGVGEMLLKENAISGRQLEEAKEKQKDSAYAEPLGRILVRDLRLAPDKLDSIASKLIEKAVYPFFLWQDGYFVFELGDYSETKDAIREDPLQHTLKKGLNPQFLAMEGLRLRDESIKAKKQYAAADGKDNVFQMPSRKESGPALGAAHDGPEDFKQFFRDLLEEVGDDGYIPGDKGEAMQSVANSKGLKVLKEMLEELARPISFNEVVLLILRFSSEIVSRSVLFSVKNNYLAGSGQSGIEIDDDIPDNIVRKMRIPLAEPSILSEAINKKGIIIKGLEKTKWNEYLMEQLGADRPIEAFAAPIIVHGKVEMVLYGDNLPSEDRLDDVSALEIFLGQTSITFERNKLIRSAS